MAIAIGLTLVMAISALLWTTTQRIALHIAIAIGCIPAVFLFGFYFGLIAGFMLAIGVMAVTCVRYACLTSAPMAQI